MEKIIIIFCVLTIPFLLIKCTGTVQLTDENLLKGDDKPDIIYIYTKDSVLFKLEEYNLVGDTLITGKGYQKINKAEESFAGAIKINSIEYILYKKINLVNTILAAGLTAYIGGNVASNIFSKKYFRVIPVYGSGSCPYLFSWDGKRYNLEGETFGIGFGRALELTTTHVLNYIDDKNKTAKIRFTNERPETHYFNNIKINAVEIDKEAEIFSDKDNKIWESDKIIQPAEAIGCLGENETEKISKKDGIYWETKRRNWNNESSFTDSLHIKFIKTGDFKEGEVIIHAINTNLSEEVFNQLGGFLGDDILDFYNSLETDSEMISIFKAWIQDISLKAYLVEGNKSEEIGYIYPEANTTPFSKAIHFKLNNTKGDTLKIMLKSLASVWKIDAVQLGTANSGALKIINIPINEAVDNKGINVASLIDKKDKKYLALLPSDYMDLTFETISPMPNKKMKYFINAGGFLYEWMQTQSSEQGYEFVNFINGNKIELLKKVLKHKTLFLPGIYNKWFEKNLPR